MHHLLHLLTARFGFGFFLLLLLLLTNTNPALLFHLLQHLACKRVIVLLEISHVVWPSVLQVLMRVDIREHLVLELVPFRQPVPNIIRRDQSGVARLRLFFMLLLRFSPILVLFFDCIKHSLSVGDGFHDLPADSIHFAVFLTLVDQHFLFLRPLLHTQSNLVLFQRVLICRLHSCSRIHRNPISVL